MQNLKFNFIKMQRYDGVWLTYTNPSRSRIERLVLKHNPKNVYVSVNKFLRYNEHNLSYRNILLERYGLCDIDGQEFESKDSCIDYFKFIVDFLSSNEILMDELVQTNSTVGGYQILINPYSYNSYMLLTRKFPEIFDKIDLRVFDIKRVRRFCPSYNSNKQSYSAFVDPQGNQIHPSGCLFVANDRGVVSDITPPHKIPGKEAIEGELPANYIVRQTSNNVYGAKGLYVPVLKFRTTPSQKYLIKLQKTYSLGDLYLFSCHTGFFAIAPKTAQYARLLKIYQNIGGRNWRSYNELAKFKQNFIPISNLIDLGQMTKINTFGFQNFIEQDAAGTYSRPHTNWLKNYYIKDYNPCAGSEKIKVYKGVFHEK